MLGRENMDIQKKIRHSITSVQEGVKTSSNKVLKWLIYPEMYVQGETTTLAPYCAGAELVLAPSCTKVKICNYEVKWTCNSFHSC